MPFGVESSTIKKKLWKDGPKRSMYVLEHRFLCQTHGMRDGLVGILDTILEDLQLM